MQVQLQKAWEELWRKCELQLTIFPFTLSKQILVKHKSFLSKCLDLPFRGLGMMLQLTPLTAYKDKNTTSHIHLLKLGGEGQAGERGIPEGRKQMRRREIHSSH